jgi:outer membrane protein assembly factor BamB
MRQTQRGARWATGLLTVLLSSLATTNGRAGDWPQILGPQRNGQAAGEKLAASWPASGPKTLWEVSCGSGFAGVAVAEGTVVLFHREGDQELLSAFAADTGKPLWKQGFPTRFQASIVDDDGPRCVPTIANGRVLAFGAEGGLHCVELKTGKPVWSRATTKEYQVPSGYFGAGSSPLVEGDRVIVNVGGPKGAGVVAFAVATGKTVWQTTDEQASYAAPVAAELDRQRRLLVITRYNFLGLDPATGKEAFRTPFGARGPTVNGASPVVVGDHALLTASYGIGARWVKLGANSAQVEWEDEVLSSQYATPIVQDGLVYAVDGRQDGGPVSLKCFHSETRKVQWTKEGIPYGTLVSADGKLLLQHTDGTARLVALKGDAYQELAKATIHRGTTRALPALSNGRWYVRNEQMLKCVEVGAAR